MSGGFGEPGWRWANPCKGRKVQEGGVCGGSGGLCKWHTILLWMQTTREGAEPGEWKVHSIKHSHNGCHFWSPHCRVVYVHGRRLSGGVWTLEAIGRRCRCLWGEKQEKRKQEENLFDIIHVGELEGHGEGRGEQTGIHLPGEVKQGECFANIR